MVCPACGTPAVEGVNFCARCGAGVVNASPYGAPPPPVAGHYGVPDPPSVWLRRNLQPLGVLWCVFAAYRVIAGLFGMVFLKAFAGNGWGRHFGNDGWGAPHGLWTALLPVIAFTTLAYAALAAFTGWSLLNRRPWGRTLAIVAGVLALFKFPLGTALGIYTLWVLAPRQAGMEWERIADRG